MANATRTTKKVATAKVATAPTAKEAKFEAAVVETMSISTPDALAKIIDLHTDAVAKKETLETKTAAFSKRNAKSLNTLKACQNRLAAARSTLLNEWQLAVKADAQTTEIAQDDEKAGIVYYNALSTDFDAGSTTGGDEKEYWLAAQSFNRVKATVESEPDSLVELRTASEKASAAFETANAVYQEAVKRQIAA